MNLKVLFVAILSFNAFANDNKTVKLNFWSELYPKTYNTLYCNMDKSESDVTVISEIYSLSKIASASQCKNVEGCKNTKFIKASTDLHNLWPVNKWAEKTLENVIYGELDESVHSFSYQKCTLERTTSKNPKFLPREEVRGAIARSYLYMIHKYDLPHYDLLPVLISWHFKHPVSPEETRRNKLIIKLQGNSNPFIGNK